MILNSLFYITRKCSLNCRYCNTVDNNFPNELTLEKKLEVLTWIKQKLGVPFVQLFGGEPLMLGDGLVDVIKHCHDIDLGYAILSSSITLDKEFATKLVKNGLKNWSVTVDTLITRPNDISKKSNKGLRDLIMFRDMGVPDLHTTMVITKHNINEITELVDQLLEYGFWVDVTALHYKKGDFYDFSPDKKYLKSLLLDETDLPKIKQISEHCIRRYQEGKKIHNEPKYFEELSKYILHQDWYCEPMSTMAIDADGTVRTCLHFNDLKDKKINIFDIHNEEQYLHTIGEPKCKGCLWTCMWQTNYWDADNEQSRQAIQHEQAG